MYAVPVIVSFTRMIFVRTVKVTSVFAASVVSPAIIHYNCVLHRTA